MPVPVPQHWDLEVKKGNGSWFLFLFLIRLGQWIRNPDILYGGCNFLSSIFGAVSGLYEMNADPQPWPNKMSWIRNTAQQRLLFRTCLHPGCDCLIVEETKTPIPVGAGLRIHGECSIGHRSTWESCEFVNKAELLTI